MSDDAEDQRIIWQLLGSVEGASGSGGIIMAAEQIPARGLEILLHGGLVTTGIIGDYDINNWHRLLRKDTGQEVRLNER
jgi:hypothetical protein